MTKYQIFKKTICGEFGFCENESPDRNKLNKVLYNISLYPKSNCLGFLRTFMINYRHIFPFSFLFWKGKCVITRDNSINRKKCYCKF